jgi:ribose transport system substrate-binding protein
MAKRIKGEQHESRLDRRGFLTIATAGLAAGPLLAACATAAPTASGNTTIATRPKKDRYKMAFIQFMPHTVPAAWSKGIEDVLTIQQNIDYQLLDGQGKADVQVNLIDTAINQGTDAIFLQPVDSVGVGPAINKARTAGIPVITLNIDSTEPHAVHVEMNHYYGAIEIGKKMGELLGGKGKVVILNAPPGIIIRDQRTNGFKEGLKQFPDIEIIADQSAEWDRKKAQDVLSTILAANKDISGVYGVNDSMALGAVDVLKQQGLLGKVVVFGNDGEKDALESIAAGELTGTQYTDVYQQGRFAASIAAALASGGVSAQSFGNQGHILMPYYVLTKDTVNTIQPNQRW